ncbi:MFS transporter [Clostridium hydrogenum]|uniref:MFS transporter n=1 Tax=Clostridium hydrogenum TaxID=2855764 RepID=UPI001F264542|nr:MFS transporter [Clostridium hydrogenum]
MKDKRNFILYLTGRFISFIGTGVQQIALPLFILDLTHSGALMGVFSALNLVPNLITSPFAGILGDRKDRRKIMVVSDFGRGILVCILGFLAFGGKLNIYILFGAQILISIMDSIFGSASSAIIGELLGEDELMRAMSARGGLDAFSMIIGPALGGVIYGFFGIKVVFFINGASFILSGIMSAFMIYVCKNHNNEKLTIKAFFYDNKEVLTFIKSNKGLMQLFTFAMLSNLLIAPFIDIVMPYVIKKAIGFSSQQYGYLMATFTIGVLIGNVGLGIFAKRIKTKATLNAGLFIEALIFLGLSISVFPSGVKFFGGPSWLFFAVLAIIFLSIGTANACVNTPIGTNLQKMVSNDMRSRFFSLLGIFSQGAVPLGSMVYGVLLDKFHYYYILLIVVILNIIVTAIFVAKAVDEVYEPKMDEAIELQDAK